MMFESFLSVKGVNNLVARQLTIVTDHYRLLKYRNVSKKPPESECSRQRARDGIPLAEQEHLTSSGINSRVTLFQLIFSVGLSALIVLVSRGEQSGTARETASLRVVTSSPLATHPPNNLSTMEVWLLRGN
ncbi:hypothetical protein J6590_105227 [Homalodisca vitripennis]|nr:hypothetical protein J6590_105227 [Homalodisca vitripennis]